MAESCHCPDSDGEVPNFFSSPEAPNLGREHQRYDNYSSQLFDLIDEIEDAKILDHAPTIPNVVAVGNQVGTLLLTEVLGH